MNENELSKIIVDAAIEVHRTLGGRACWKVCIATRWQLRFKAAARWWTGKSWCLFYTKDRL